MMYSGYESDILNFLGFWITALVAFIVVRWIINNKCGERCEFPVISRHSCKHCFSDECAHMRK
jgi:hypothetical protein